MNKRISTNSSSEEIFNTAKTSFSEALKNSGYAYNMTYDSNTSIENPETTTETSNNDKTTKRKRNRKRKVTYFNPPFCSSVKTNIGKIFLNLVDKHFPKHHKLHKIINRNTIKVSYSCLPNLQQIINSHNRQILNKHRQNDTKPTEKRFCNCRYRSECPVGGKCLEQNVIYKATVLEEDNNKQKFYIGLTSNSFKTRFNQHQSSFRLDKKRNSTTLSNYIWTLKDRDRKFRINWEILRKTNMLPLGQTCTLCIEEKLFILRESKNPDNLNSRTEMFSQQCPHHRKYSLSTTTSNTLQPEESPTMDAGDETNL